MSILFGPQVYAQPPLQVPTPSAVQATVTLSPPQPAQEVVQTPSHEGSGTASDQSSRNGQDGQSFDPHGQRRGRLLNVNG